MAKFKYLRTSVTNKTCIQEEIKSRINLWNSCYHCLQSVLFSRFVSANVKYNKQFYLFFCICVRLRLSH
jgi:hypothetical protein